MSESMSDPPSGAEPESPPEREKVAPIIQTGTAPEEMTTLIARQPFFAGLPPRLLERLAGEALVMQYEIGQQILNEGEPANRFYLILEGQVVLEAEGEEHSQTPLQTLGPGEDLGWSWLFRPYYLHFSARALTRVRVLFFYGTRLRQHCEADHELGYELLKRVGEVVVKRVELMRRKLSETPDWRG